MGTGFSGEVAEYYAKYRRGYPPELFDVLHFDAATREAVAGFARNLENWLAGILNWHQGCHRYGEADLISSACPARPELFATPSGLGTSAVRIFRTLQRAR